MQAPESPGCQLCRLQPQHRPQAGIELCDISWGEPGDAPREERPIERDQL